MKENPLIFDQVDQIRDGIQKSLDKDGAFEEYIPTNKGVVILGGDIADFQGGERKQDRNGQTFDIHERLLCMSSDRKTAGRGSAFSEK